MGGWATIPHLSRVIHGVMKYHAVTSDSSRKAGCSRGRPTARSRAVCACDADRGSRSARSAWQHRVRWAIAPTRRASTSRCAASRRAVLHAVWQRPHAALRDPTVRNRSTHVHRAVRTAFIVPAGAAASIE